MAEANDVYESIWGAAGGDQVFGNHLGDETGVHTLREWEKEME